MILCLLNFFTIFLMILYSHWKWRKISSFTARLICHSLRTWMIIFLDKYTWGAIAHGVCRSTFVIAQGSEVSNTVPWTLRELLHGVVESHFWFTPKTHHKSISRCTNSKKVVSKEVTIIPHRVLLNPKEARRRKITVTSSLKEITTDQLGSRAAVVRGEGVTPPASIPSTASFWTDF